jgi:hypothetical protein
MFWQSVWLGLANLSHWQIWVGVLGILVALALGKLSLALLVPLQAIPVLGCGFVLFGVVLSEVVGCILTGFVVVFIFPDIMVGKGLLPFNIYASLVGPTLISGLMSAAVVAVICFIPFVGPFITSMPGVTISLQCIFVFRFMAELVFRDLPGNYKRIDEAFPGFWLTCAFIAIGSLLAWVATIVIAVLDHKLQRKTDIAFVDGRWTNEKQPSVFF